MENTPTKHAPVARFFILDWTTPYANSADLEQMLSIAQREHKLNPNKTFIVAQVVATIEPVTTSTITFHRT